MQCLQASGGELSVLERQMARLNWQQQQQQLVYRNLHADGTAGGYAMDGLAPQEPWPVLAAGNEEGADNVDGNVHWPDLAGAQFPVACSANAVGREESGNDPSNKGSKKRKAESSPKQKQENSSIVTEDRCNKRMKEGGGGARRCSSKKDASGDTSKEKSQQPKADYIHVRARRGQATDSHSLAERVRRERISERMKYLQELVPGCNKITGKAGMLDEIINYVQSLQRQVEFLSMKLAAVNPGMELYLDTLFSREMYPVCNSGSNVATASDQLELPYLQLNALKQSNACSGLHMVMNTPDFALRSAATSTPAGMADPFLDSCFSVYGSALESNFNNIYSGDLQQGKVSSFPFHLLQGGLLLDHHKM